MAGGPAVEDAELEAAGDAGCGFISRKTACEFSFGRRSEDGGCIRASNLAPLPRRQFKKKKLAPGSRTRGREGQAGRRSGRRRDGARARKKE
jgi:hypothetical protein